MSFSEMLATYITIDDDISIGSGTLTLDSAAGVTQNASDDITAAKLLLLGYAFESLGCVAVGFKTSAHNHASRAAILRLGARQDGVLRNHMRHRDGSLRDSVYFSILDTEWPAVKRNLIAKLERHRHG